LNHHHIEAIAHQVIALYDEADRLGEFTAELADINDALLIPLSHEDFEAVHDIIDRILVARAEGKQ
jgi:hypothetical protein